MGVACNICRLSRLLTFADLCSVTVSAFSAIRAQVKRPFDYLSWPVHMSMTWPTFWGPCIVCRVPLLTAIPLVQYLWMLRHPNFRLDPVICSCLPLNSHLGNCLFQFLRHIAVNYLGDTAGLYKLPLRRVPRSCLGRHQTTDVFIHQPGQSDIYWLSGSPSVRHSVSRQSENGETGGLSGSLGEHFVSLLLFGQWIHVSCMRIMKLTVAMRKCVSQVKSTLSEVKLNARFKQFYALKCTPKYSYY